MSIPKYVSSFAVGFLFGAGLALMIAPMPGKKMQKKVGEKVDHLKIAARRMAS